MIFECKQPGLDATHAKASYGYAEAKMGCSKDTTMIKTGLTANPKQGCKTKGHFYGWKLFVICYSPHIIKRKSLFSLLLSPYIFDWNTSFWSSLPNLSIRGNISSLLLVYKLAELHLRPLYRTIVPKKKVTILLMYCISILNKLAQKTGFLGRI